MANVEISQELLEILEDVAKREHRSLSEVVESALKNFAQEHSAQPPNDTTKGYPLLMIAEAANQLGIGSGEGDISERSRDILKANFADDLDGQNRPLPAVKRHSS
jgi:metal-responsive CopG/Arc/MetJ family transcriptional regulator